MILFVSGMRRHTRCVLRLSRYRSRRLTAPWLPDNLRSEFYHTGLLGAGASARKGESALCPCDDESQSGHNLDFVWRHASANFSVVFPGRAFYDAFRGISEPRRVLLSRRGRNASRKLQSQVESSFLVPCPWYENWMVGSA